jgi:prephenate dehydrogenase
MTVGIIGLGLIGGSLARALAAHTAHRVLGWDREAATREAALGCGAIQGLLAPDAPLACDVVVVAVPPRATLDVLDERAPRVAPDTLVVDCCGVKRAVCARGFALAARHGFTFIGGHPMAGRERAGFAAALPTLFRGASMLLVPDARATPASRARAESLFREAGFERIVFTTAEHHDRMIALTSQLAHVVSNAYVKSPRAAGHAGFSAGSFADLTRVARLDERLWCELFLENRDNLLVEIDTLLEALRPYRDALAAGDAGRLTELLRAGRECKENL